jgi:hypothetical protein
MGCRVVEAMNGSSRVNSQPDRPSGLEDGQGDDILDQHLLLAAETAAHTFANDADLFRVEIEQIG